MFAAATDTECLIELITSGADVNIQNKNQETALMFAAGMGKTNHTEILFSAGAEVNNGCECLGNGALMSEVGQLCGLL